MIEDPSDRAERRGASPVGQTDESSGDPIEDLQVVLVDHPSFEQTISSTGLSIPVSTAADRKESRTVGADALPAQWGNLSILRKLGSGAYADVFVAHDPTADRLVALKLYRLQTDPTGIWQTRAPGVVAKEATLLSRLRHPNVIEVFGSDCVDGQIGIWMELIEGQTLRALLDTQGVFSPQEATEVGRQLCRALAAAHHVRLLHRDVTAGNVMKATDGRYVLMDFGVGAEHRKIGDQRVFGESGTPLYMPEETLLRHNSAVTSDIYSLGVLLFHLVTNRFPLEGRTLRDLRRAHLKIDKNARVWLCHCRPDLPDAFVRVVEKAIAPDFRKRYANAEEMEAALAGWEAQAASGTVVDGKPSWAEKAREKDRRRREKRARRREKRRRRARHGLQRRASDIAWVYGPVVGMVVVAAMVVWMLVRLGGWLVGK